MKHYIFTRFNLLDAKTTIYNNPKIKDPDVWMQHRLLHFHKCLWSMMNQTNQNFIWLLSFAKKTPKSYIDDYINNHSFGDLMIKEERLKIIYEYPADWLRKQNLKGWLITSRLDNDDYYHKDFIKTIQEHFNEKTEIIDIDYYQYDFRTNKYFDSGRIAPNSPFLSLVEYVRPGAEAITCFFCSHTNMPKYFRAFKIPKRLATMVIHDRNITNKIVGDEIKKKI